MTAKWWAFGLWLAVAASAVYWALQLFVPGQPVPAHAGVAVVAASPRGDLSRLFGVDAVAPAEAPVPTSSRFQLLGVVAPRHGGAGREGVALIAVDGQMPKAYRVGAQIEDGLVLQSVAQRGASLGPRDGAPSVALDIPPPAPAATGALPVAGFQPPGMAPGVAPPRQGTGFTPPPRVPLPSLTPPPQPTQEAPITDRAQQLQTE
jgi:general secretion pathway protein C